MGYKVDFEIKYGLFTWSSQKAQLNFIKHGIDFFEAVGAFLDPNRIIATDNKHSESEKRFFCIGKITNGIITVRFTYRESTIRIIGAGYWRKGKTFYEKENNEATKTKKKR